MPRYLFCCDICKEEFSVFCNISDKNPICINCGSEKIIKIFKAKDKSLKEKVDGSLMNEHIQETREEIESIKKELSEDGF